MNSIRTAIKQIYCGKVEEINDGKRKLYPSAYRKKQMTPHQPLFVNSMGFIDDMQGDTVITEALTKPYVSTAKSTTTFLKIYTV